MKVFIVKLVLHKYGLKCRSWRKKLALQKQHQKADYIFQMHSETEIFIFGDMYCGLKKKNGFGHNEGNL